VTLASFNAAPEQEAVAAMLACCASRRFAVAMAAGRPYPSLAAAELAIEAVFESLTWPDVLEAMGAHPRIGAQQLGEGALAAPSLHGGFLHRLIGRLAAHSLLRQGQEYAL